MFESPENMIENNCIMRKRLWHCVEQTDFVACVKKKNVEREKIVLQVSSAVGYKTEKVAKWI